MSRSTGSTSPLDEYLDRIGGWMEEGLTNAQIVASLAILGVTTSEGSIRRCRPRIEKLWGRPVKRPSGQRVPKGPGENDPSCTVSGDEASVSSGKQGLGPDERPLTPEELITASGLDLEDWSYDDPDITWWGHPGNKFYRMRLKLKRRRPLDFILPARDRGYQPPVSRSRKKESGPKLWVFPGDQQAPYHSAPFHGAFLSFLEEEKPDHGVLMGDGTDNPDVSTHRTNPAWNATLQECLDSYHDILCDYLTSSPRTQWQKLFGNHEWRVQRLILDKAAQLYGLRTANSPDDHSVLSMTHLLRLDELGIEAVEPVGEYTHAQIQVAPDLIARHGWLTGPNAMNKALSGLTCSIIYGHVHSSGSKSGTRWTPEGAPSHVHAFENGTMCEIRGGQGFSVDSNWSPCFSTVVVWPDGRWHHDFARFGTDGMLYWRGKRYG